MNDSDNRSPARVGAAELRGLLLRMRSAWARLALASGAINLLMLVPTLYMLQVYDRVMISRNPLTLLAVSLVAAALLVVIAMAESWRSRWQVRASLGLEAALAPRVFRASAEAGLNSLNAPGAQPLVDLTALRQFLAGPGVHALFDTPWTPIFLAVLWLLHPQLAGLALVFVGLQFALALWSQRLLAEPTAAAHAAQRQEQLLLRGTARHVEVAESLGMLPALRRHWGLRRTRQCELGVAQQDLTQRLAAASRLLRHCQQSASLALGAWLVIEGQISVGAMIAANVLMTRALAPIDALVGQWRAALGARQAFQRLAQLLQDQPVRAGEPLQAEPLGQLQLVGLRATVPGRQAPLLDGVNLIFEPGTVTAVMGPSGAGKSTLARVVVGLWPQPQGEVLLDGRPLAGFDRAALARHLGWLPQDIELLDGSVAEQIARFTRPDPAQVIAAAQACGLHEAILRLPRGYDTPVGEGGHLLSGGMRQRIALARAVYGAPRLVVLDEPNANLDEAGEAALLRLLQTLKQQGSTVLLVCHRPAVLAAADRIVRLQDGRVVADGPRDEVLAALAPRPAAGGRAAPAVRLQPT